MSPTRFVALPFSGGTAWSYRPLAARLEPFHTLDYPGHGRRMSEPLRDSIDGLVDAVVEAAKTESWAKKPFVLFGHSLGSQVAAYAAKPLLDLGTPMRGLVVSGSTPMWHQDRDPIHGLPDDEFIAEIVKRGHGDEALQRPEVRELVTPILRADFKACEIAPSGLPAPVPVPVLAISGEADDDCTPEALGRWSQIAEGTFETAFFPGGHFFLLQESLGPVADTLSRFR